MPYSDTSSLPGHVQSLPAKKKRQWMHVFNSSLASAKKDGKDDKEAEAIAFRNANGVVKVDKSDESGELSPKLNPLLLINKMFNTIEKLSTYNYSGEVDSSSGEKPHVINTSRITLTSSKSSLDTDGETHETFEMSSSTMENFTREVIIKSVDEVERIVYGVVMEPTATGDFQDGKFVGKVEDVDAHGHFTTAKEVRKAMIGFMEELAKSKEAPHNLQHNNNLPEVQTAIIENWQAPEDTTLGGKLVKAGSWIQGTKIYSDAIWGGIVKGTITGYSIEGLGLLTDVEDAEEGS